MTVKVTIIAACDKNRGIGLKGQMPWHIPQEFKHFKETTENHIVIMGRKTYESIPGGEGLKNRLNIVVSSSLDTIASGIIMPSPEKAYRDAYALAHAFGRDIFIIGGYQIFTQMESVATDMIISEIDGVYDVDTYLPDFKDTWVEDTSKQKTVDNQFTVKYFSKK